MSSEEKEAEIMEDILEIQTAESDEEKRTREIKERAELWSKVDYRFVSFVQFTSSPNEFLILLGERLPPDGRIRPLQGIVLSPTHARSVLKAFTKAVERQEAIEKAKAEMAGSSEIPLLDDKQA